jgi:hypothetical protein
MVVPASDDHRPGWRVPEQVREQDLIIDAAHRDYCGWLRGAHQTPVADAKPAKPRPISHADAQQAADSAREENSPSRT